MNSLASMFGIKIDPTIPEHVAWLKQADEFFERIIWRALSGKETINSQA